MRMRAKVLLSFSLWLPVAGWGAVIDVLVVWDQSAFGSPSVLQDEAGRIIASANSRMFESEQDPSHTFRLIGTRTSSPIPISGPYTHPYTQLHNATVSNTLTDRNNFGADLIAVVVTDLGTFSGDIVCGSAFVNPNTAVHKNNANFYFVVAFKRDCIAAGSEDLERVPLHELGHLLSAEHEFGTHAGADTNQALPVYYNHPDITGNRATLMWSGLPAPCPPSTGCNQIVNRFSTNLDNYPGTTIPMGHVFDRNNHAMINSAFPVVAQYRAPPPPSPAPPPPACSLSFGACINFKQSYLPSWEHDTSAPIPPFPTFDADRSDNNGATWTDFFTGGQGCAPTTPPTQGRLIRVRITSSYGESPYCTIFIPFSACEDSP